MKNKFQEALRRFNDNPGSDIDSKLLATIVTTY